MRLAFYVDERVLIPRSPIAELLENGLQPWLGKKPPHKILDLCTGCACIAIAAAYIFPEAEISASDISTAALEVAAINVDQHALKQQVSLYQSDLFASLPKVKYDVILCNPPYVSAASMQALPEEYRHEPRLALMSEKNGLDIPIKILTEAKHYLAEQGLLILEVGESQERLEAAFPQFPFTWCQFERGGEGVLVITHDELKNLGKYAESI
jgi:ribosomal protein L3 glutamine methyltransferase